MNNPIASLLQSDNPIPTVVVVLTILSSTLTHPISTQDDATSGIEGVSQQVQKTGTQGSFYVNAHAQTNQAEKSTVHLGTSEEYPKVNNAQQVTQTEKTEAEIFSNVFASQQNAAVPKIENVPVNVHPAQPSYTENPVLLPIQPLSVVPANQADQVLQSLIVPLKIIPAERMVIMATDSFQQRNFQQDVTSVPESQISSQQVIQPVTYSQVPTQNVEPNQQPNYVISFEKPDQGYFPVRVQPNLNTVVREQTLSDTQTSQQSASPVSNYNEAPVEPSAQVYSGKHSEQPVIVENAKVQFVEPSVQQQKQQEQHYHVQQSVEKQGPYQQSTFQGQSNFVKPGFENVVKQAPYQQNSNVQTQNVEQNYQQQQDYNTQQAVKKQEQYQQVNSYTSTENQPAKQSVYNVQPVLVEKTEKVGQYQESYTPVQVQLVQQQQTQNAQQVTEKQLPYQQPVAAQIYPVEPANQQQVFNVQPVGQVENQVQYQKGSQFQNVGFFLEKAPENPDFKPNQQVFNVQPQEGAHYSGEYSHPSKDEASQLQQNAHYILTSVPQTQDYSVQTPVGSA